MKHWALPVADTYFASRLSEDGFEIDHLWAAMRHVTCWRTAVDGGAHVGTWSVEMAKTFARVLAFEPAPDTFQCLQENLRGLLNVTPHRVALAQVHTYGMVVDDLTRQGNTGARYMRSAAGAGDVLVRPLDEYGIEDLDLLKLDLEGYEFFALLGAQETIKRCRPVVVIEEKKGMAERHGLAFGAASEFLQRLGARCVGGVRNDRIFTFEAG